jgi:hypothetical protein
LVQYFEPFTTVDLSRMAMAFNFTTDAAKQAMIGELAVLIDHGRLNARLDMIDMVRRRPGLITVLSPMLN